MTEYLDKMMAWKIDPLGVEIVLGVLILFGIWGVSSALDSIHKTLHGIDVTLDRVNASLDAIQSACEEVADNTQREDKEYDTL